MKTAFAAASIEGRMPTGIRCTFLTCQECNSIHPENENFPKFIDTAIWSHTGTDNFPPSFITVGDLYFTVK